MQTEGEIRKWLELLERARKQRTIYRTGEHRQKSHKAGFTMGIRRI
jgi:hypothetical protein